MGIFSRRRDIHLPPGDDECIVVGDEYYGGVPRALGTGRQVQVELRREPTNPHDANAVMVWAGRKVGYLSSTAAARHRPALDGLGRVRIFATAHVRKTGSGYRTLFVMMPRVKH